MLDVYRNRYLLVVLYKEDIVEQVMYWLVGGIGVPLIQWLKNTFDLKGKQALWLTVGVSVILAVAALFTSQELSINDFSPENLLAVFGQVLAAATLAYKFLNTQSS
jgi:hypothetical protein